MQGGGGGISFVCPLPPEGAQNVLVLILVKSTICGSFADIQTSTVHNESIILLPVSVLEVYLMQTYEAESRWAQWAPVLTPCCVSSIARKEGRRSGKNAHSCILQPRSLFACSVSIFTRLHLPFKSETFISSFIFSQKVGFLTSRPILGAKQQVVLIYRDFIS